MNAKQLLEKNGFKGEILVGDDIPKSYSFDASMFELTPRYVIFPKDSDDVKLAVKTTIERKKESGKHVSLTVRSGGTDMSGGSIGQSIVMDMTKYFNNIYEVSAKSARAQPGVYYRDFDKATLEFDAIMPSYPASRDLCTIGGMVSNNAGGEKSLQFGKTENFVKQLKVVFYDGKEYTVKPLTKPELVRKMAQGDFEGNIYKQIFELCEEKYDLIKDAKPNVSKDSTGYHIWNVWDRKTGIFDLTQLIIGSQGTLGIVTDITFELVRNPKYSGTLVMFLKDLDNLGDVISDVMKYKPATFEGFDNYTLMLSFKLFFSFRKTLGWLGVIKLAFQLIPTALHLARGIPKMVLLVEFNADSPQAVTHKIKDLRKNLNKYKGTVRFEETDTAAKAKKFWLMRRESFNLLRSKVKKKHTAPFIDDLVVNPEHLSKFLPELRVILDEYKFMATIAGHMGDGNFHVIPLMEFDKKLERIKLEPAMREVNELVLKYGGSLSGEHNDGMSRGPWLHQMYDRKVMQVFKDIKKTFDPTNIFNPDKKTDAHWEFSLSHMRKDF